MVSSPDKQPHLEASQELRSHLITTIDDPLIQEIAKVSVTGIKGEY